MNNFIGNATTIVKFLTCMIFPYCATMGLTQDQLGAILTLIVGFAFAYIDAKYPNTFKALGNNVSEAQTEEETEC